MEMFVKNCAVPGFISTPCIRLNDPNIRKVFFFVFFISVPVIYLSECVECVDIVREAGNIYYKLNDFSTKNSE